MATFDAYGSTKYGTGKSPDNTPQHVVAFDGFYAQGKVNGIVLVDQYQSRKPYVIGRSDYPYGGKGSYISDGNNYYIVKVPCK